MKKVISLILSVVMVLSITAGLNVTAFADGAPLDSSPQTVSDGVYRISSKVNYDLSVNVESGGTNIALYSDESRTDQYFDIEYSSDTHFYTITHVATQKVLEVEDEYASNVKLAEASDADTQKWVIEYVGDEDPRYFYIRPACSGYSLDLVDGLAQDGQNIRVWYSNQQDAQKWMFTPYLGDDSAVIPDGNYTVMSAVGKYKCLNASSDGNLEIWTTNDGDNQLFSLTYLDNGCYKIKNSSLDAAVDLANGSPIAGTNISLYNDHGLTNQQWVIRPAGDGYYYIISREVGLCFDVQDGTNKDGTNVRGFVGNGTAGQKWKFVCDEHKWDDGIVTEEATCITTGEKKYTCTVCGETKTEKTERAEHTSAPLAAVAATCTTDGLTAGSYCTVCGKVITAQETVKAAGHEYTSVVTEPTCSSHGYTTYSCKNCDDVFVADYTDKTEHTIAAIDAVAPACTATGLTKGYKCSVCDKVIVAQETVDALGHDYAAVVTAPTCTSQGYTTYTCTRCGDSYVDDYTEIIEHSWDDGVVTVKATPTATGERTYTCTACNETRTEEIAKCAKYANPIKVKAKTATVKFANLKKKNQTVAAKNALTVTKAQGKLTYAKTKGNKKITVAKNGKITVKKGLKKGTYKIKVKVTAAGNETYKAKAVTVTVTIKVK